MSQNLSIERFEPVRLTVQNLGPFQERTEAVDFTDEDNAPCNLFLLLSKNGRGKTTLLNALTYLVGLLDPRNRSPVPDWLRDHKEARLQLDVRVSVSGRPGLILSIYAGTDSAELRFWDDAELDKVQCKDWVRWGYSGGHLVQPEYRILSASFGQLSKSADQAHQGEAERFLRALWNEMALAADRRPSGFESPIDMLPTVIYFTATRDILRLDEHEERAIAAPKAWGWRMVHRFDQEGRRWSDSPDNLLVWMSWLGDGRMEQAQRLINVRVFRGETKMLHGVRRDPPEAIVRVDSKYEHRIDQLSAGERMLIQFVLRVGAHMTRNTWVIVDEADLHLHPNWEVRMMNLLRDLVKDQPGVTVIATAQSLEFLRAFAYHISWERLGIRKGGHLIEADLEVDKDEDVSSESYDDVRGDRTDGEE